MGRRSHISLKPSFPPCCRYHIRRLLGGPNPLSLLTRGVVPCAASKRIFSTTALAAGAQRAPLEYPPGHPPHRYGWGDGTPLEPLRSIWRSSGETKGNRNASVSNPPAATEFQTQQRLGIGAPLPGHPMVRLQQTELAQIPQTSNGENTCHISQSLPSRQYDQPHMIRRIYSSYIDTLCDVCHTEQRCFS